MSRQFDIRKYKRKQREKYKAMRKNMDATTKTKKDAAIRRQVLKMREYKKYDLFLCYVSLSHEIDTKPLLERAIEDGKTVAVPYCIDGTRDMDFYKITSLDQLERRTFGVLEPVATPENKITNFENSLCILPGLTFDRFGYRIGYGGGYYDRFLSRKFKGVSAGICYQHALQGKIIHGRYDVPCDFLVTEQRIRRRQRSKRKTNHNRKPKRGKQGKNS